MPGVMRPIPSAPLYTRALITSRDDVCVVSCLFFECKMHYIYIYLHLGVESSTLYWYYLVSIDYSCTDTVSPSIGIGHAAASKGPTVMPRCASPRSPYGVVIPVAPQ